MFSAIFLAFLFAAESTPPQRPAEIPWPGGKWTGDDADRGKEFPKGAFKYTPRAEWNAYLKASHEWIAANVPAPKINAFNIAPTLAALERPGDAKYPWLNSSGKLAAFGGSGTIDATYDVDGCDMKIELENVDFEQMRAWLQMNLPIRVTGTIGSLSGRISGTKGRFHGTKVRTNGVTVSQMGLEIDFATGEWSAWASTNHGQQNLTGRARR